MRRGPKTSSRKLLQTLIERCHCICFCCIENWEAQGPMVDDKLKRVPPCHRYPGYAMFHSAGMQKQSNMGGRYVKTRTTQPLSRVTLYGQRSKDIIKKNYCKHWLSVIIALAFVALKIGKLGALCPPSTTPWFELTRGCVQAGSALPCVERALSPSDTKHRLFILG